MKLKSIKVPVLYMPSQTDLYFPVEDARYEARFITHCTLAVIPSLWWDCAPLVAAGDALGLEVIQEIYADRGYTETGQLIPRGQPGAMIEGAEEAAARVLAMVEATVAHDLGITAGTVKSTTSRALAKLRVSADDVSAPAIGGERS